jgi:hypothetical protein
MSARLDGDEEQGFVNSLNNTLNLARTDVGEMGPGIWSRPSEGLHSVADYYSVQNGLEIVPEAKPTFNREE